MNNQSDVLNQRLKVCRAKYLSKKSNVPSPLSYALRSIRGTDEYFEMKEQYISELIETQQFDKANEEIENWEAGII